MATEYSTIVVRRGNADAWENSSRPLASGEWGYDETSRVIKIGDGYTLWRDLASTITAGVTGQLPDDVRQALAANLANPETAEGAEVAASAAAGLPFDGVSGLYLGASENPIPSVDGTTKQFPGDVRATQAANLRDPATPEGSAVVQAVVDAGPVAALIDPSNFRRWQRALARVRLGVSDAKFLNAGDSTTWGGGGDATNAPNGSYPKRLVDLGLGGVNIAQGLSVPPSAIAGSSDARWVYGGGWSQNANGFGTGAAFAGNTSAGANSMTFTPGFNCDTFDVYFIGLPDTGTINVGIDSAAAVAKSTVLGAPGVSKFTVTGSLASSHVLKFGNVTGGSVFIIGVEAYDSTRKQVRVANAGVGSSKSSHWATDTPGYGSLSCIKAYAPNLSVLNLGINDAYQGVPLTTWQANMESIIDACLVSGDVILQTVVPSDAVGHPEVEAQFRDAAFEIGKAKNIGVVDIFGRFGSWASAKSLGFVTGALHPNALGYYDIANAVRSAVLDAS